MCSAAKNPTPVRKRSEGESTAGRSRPEECWLRGLQTQRRGNYGAVSPEGGQPADKDRDFPVCRYGILPQVSAAHSERLLQVPAIPWRSV